MTSKMPPLIISETDYYALTTLIDGLPPELSDSVEPLMLELERAKIWPDALVPQHVVTMYSTVEFEDLNTGKVRSLQLTYPCDANIEEGRISVLAPTGGALLGLSVGQKIAWKLPSGKHGRFAIRKVTRPHHTFKKLVNG